jgi:hypothetical protein
MRTFAVRRFKFERTLPTPAAPGFGREYPRVRRGAWARVTPTTLGAHHSEPFFFFSLSIYIVADVHACVWQYQLAPGPARQVMAEAALRVIREKMAGRPPAGRMARPHPQGTGSTELHVVDNAGLHCPRFYLGKKCML